MSKEEALKRLQELDPDEICKYCIYEFDCGKEVTGGPNGPIYPPCIDCNLEDLIDIDTCIKDLAEV